VQPLVRFWVFFLTCALFAAVLSPWIYLGIQWSAITWGWGWLKYLAGHPFHRYFNRVLQLSIVIGILGLLKRTGFSSFHAFGFQANRPFYLILLGFGSSLVFLGGYALMIFELGWQRAVRVMPGGGWMGIGEKIFFSAVMVGFLEETFFRGYFYQLCRREIGYIRALAFNAVFFSLVHYLKPPRLEDLRAVDWSSGFQMLGIALQRFADFGEMASGLLVLMWVAVVLCWTLERTSSLYLAIGLHAGWIVALQWNSELAHDATGWPTWVLGGGNLSQGIVSLIPLILQFLVLKWWLGSTSEYETRKAEVRQ